MKIAIFTETYLPNINGVVTHVMQLKEGLEQLGHEVMIVTADQNGTAGGDTVITMDGEGTKIVRCPAVKFTDELRWLSVASPLSYSRLRAVKDFRPDIIHVHNEFGVGVSGMLIARTIKVPIVYTLHTMYEEYVYYIAKRKPADKTLMNGIKLYAQALAASADALIGPSAKVEDFFRKCGVKKPVYVIPNPVETKLFTPMDARRRAKVRAKYGISGDEFVFCFCGRLGKEKNIHLLLESFGRWLRPDDRLKLLIIGGGAIQKELESAAKKLCLPGSVIFTGSVPHEKLPPYISACDAYITASTSDTCSISMLEAMSSGLPVLHIRDELNAGQIVEGQNGYYWKNDTELYKLMKRLSAMPKRELARFSDSARRTVLESGATGLAERVLKVYKTTIMIGKLK